ncbi:MAG TPA: ABC transporter ATP-binding protein/permease [Fibrobacteria bacterium]|nr:ABC transporter ATP-binding protein/permease [Fibrobacteria bacterium]
MKTSHRLGIPAFALGRGLSEAGFVLTVKAGLTGHDSPLLLAAIPLLVLLRFVFQDRGAILEAAALRDGVASWRRRVLDALRHRAVPAWRPGTRRTLGHALEEDIPVAAEGALARRRLLGAILEGAVLLPLLFLIAWKAALVGIAAATLLWPVLRRRNRRMKAHERAGAAGRESARQAREDFSHALEALPGAGFTEAVARLDRTLDEAHAPTWRWRRAQARYPALLETALFFVLCVILFTGALTLPGLESVLLFAMLLLLTYRPLREAARQYPVAAAGRRAAQDIDALVAAWNTLPPRTVPAAHPHPNTFGVRNLTFGYEPDAPILRDVTLAFAADAITGLTGPNGAGKTTLLRILVGAETPQAGAVLWPAAAHEAATRGLAIMPQRAWPGHDWPAWAAAYQAENPDAWRALDALLGVQRLREKSFHPESLSGGERQRMALARTLTSDAACLLLDEPTTSLPADEREHVLRGAIAFWKAAAPEPRGALIVSHEPFLENLCDTVIRMTPNGGAA